MKRSLYILGLTSLYALQTSAALASFQKDKGEYAPAILLAQAGQRQDHEEQQRELEQGGVNQPDARMEASLVDPEQKAKRHEATVQVKVEGINMIDPAQTDGRPKLGQGHLHYRFDDGPVIATTATKLSFHEVPTGQHTIAVWLAGNNHQAVTRQAKLDFRVP